MNNLRSGVKSGAIALGAFFFLGVCLSSSRSGQPPSPGAGGQPPDKADAKKDGGEDLDKKLTEALNKAGFTGLVESSLEKRLGRPIDAAKSELGRHLFFDRFIALHNDNSCAGCHSPTAGFADTQSIAIGVDNNDFVGPSRAGPRNQRRTPSVINNAFYPKLMLNGRFSAQSGDPFDNSKGFSFPDPESTTRFPPNDREIRQLLVAQAHIPVTELPEMAGFTKIRETSFTTSRLQTKSSFSFSLFKDPASSRVVPKINPQAKTHIQVFSQRSDDLKRSGAPEPQKPVIDFTQFDHPPHSARGVAIPPPITIEKAKDGGGREIIEFRNEPIRDVVLGRLNANESYRKEFAKVFLEVSRGGPITFSMVGQAIAEFEFTLTFADAPVDRFARGDTSALTDAQKRGALLFFGKAKCATCHAAEAESPSSLPAFHHEMFSDFKMRNIGVPQIAPKFGTGEDGKLTGNFPFRRRDGENAEDGLEDWGLFDITGDAQDRFKFRTSPLRNIATHPTFFHNGCFTRLEDAIRHHLDVEKSLKAYDPAAAGVAADLRRKANNVDDLLQQLDPALKQPIPLSDQEFKDLVAFVRDGLLDRRAKEDNLRRLIPDKLPSGEPLAEFEKSAKGH